MVSRPGHLHFLNFQSMFFSVVVVAILCTKFTIEAQESFFDFGICACTPSTYDFQLDVSQGCPATEPVGLIRGAGVESVECSVVSTSSETIDLVPASIQSIMVQELRQDNTVAVSQSIEGDFRDGDAFRYISVSADLEDIRGAVDIPKILRFDISGTNEDGDEVSHTMVMKFTNDCETYPVIQAGGRAGWIRFLETIPPNLELCVAVSQTTQAPSSMPSDLPSMVPSNQPSEAKEDSSIVTASCTICPVIEECIQSPNELYPNVNNTAMQVTCGEVEQFALFSSDLTTEECSLLQANVQSGFCGGCGGNNCLSVDGVSQAANPPTTSFPTASPTLQPTTSSPSVSPSGFPSQAPSISFPSVTPSTATNRGPLSHLYELPPEWRAESEVLVSCSLCPGGCVQSPDELFPNMEEGMEVSCGVVEEFAFSAGLSISHCTLLKTYLFLGTCGGCGSNDCT
ncbi:hypothetical protein IV203_004321 [Nitzschia inconspicua]|uniref:Uncharacterized protein n=1 Tax=Nitzschia inconspicua TaxID=303405 RepID=A0A9K3L3J0_9STRA|nr:hypothetical protein IV203_004321 [Nitzschia inconspicua]